MLVKNVHLGPVLPCSKCQSLLEKSLTATNSGGGIEAGMRKGGAAAGGAPAAGGSSSSSSSGGGGGGGLFGHAFTLHRLPDGSWISEDCLPTGGTAAALPAVGGSGAGGMGGMIGSGGIGPGAVRYFYRPREGAFEFVGTLEGQSALRALARAPPGSAAGDAEDEAGARSESVVPLPAGSAFFPLRYENGVIAVASDAVAPRPGSSGAPPTPCWYCGDKLWVTFMDMTTYPVSPLPVCHPPRLPPLTARSRPRRNRRASSRCCCAGMTACVPCARCSPLRWTPLARSLV